MRELRGGKILWWWGMHEKRKSDRSSRQGRCLGWKGKKRRWGGHRRILGGGNNFLKKKIIIIKWINKWKENR